MLSQLNGFGDNEWLLGSTINVSNNRNVKERPEKVNETTRSCRMLWRREEEEKTKKKKKNHKKQRGKWFVGER